MGLSRTRALYPRLRSDRHHRAHHRRGQRRSKKTKKPVAIKRKLGASPLLFGNYLTDHCAFIGLEGISDGLPSYREEVVSVGMEEPLKTAYQELEKEITACLKEHRGNSSVVSTMPNTLLA